MGITPLLVYRLGQLRLGNVVRSAFDGHLRMEEHPIDSWQLGDWNQALFQHYFSEGIDTSPVTRLAVTSEELSKAIKNIAEPDDARKSLVSILRKTLAHRSLGSDAQRRADQWKATDNVVPPFIAHLLFTCMVVGDVAEQLESVGDFRRRLTVLLGWGTGHGLDRLPSLWQLLSDWLKLQYERQRPVRRLVLPLPPAHLVIIGYPYCLAFPTRRDHERLRKIFRAEQLLGVEPPVVRVFKVLEDKLALFTPQFQKTYLEFRDLYHASAPSVSGASAFWTVVRDAALKPSAEEPGPSRLPKLQLALELDVDGYSLVIMSSREFSIKDYATSSFPLGLNDYPFLVVRTDDTPIDAALLEAFRGRSAAVLPSIFRDLGSAIRDGVLLFVADETGQIYLHTRDLPEAGRVFGLVTDTLHHRFTVALQKAALEAECSSRRSRYPGWNEIEISNGATLSDVVFGADSVLSEIRCLQQVLRPSRIALVGGARAGSSYVGLTRFLPNVVAESADTVILQSADQRESISLQRTSDGAIWRFPLDAPAQHLDGTYHLRAFAKDELVDRRTVSFSLEVRGTEYVSPSNPDLWLGEAGSQESTSPLDWPAAPGDCFEASACKQQAVVFDSLPCATEEPKPTDQSPIVDELISFLAARSCYQQGIPEFELVELFKEHLGLDWNWAWYVLRAWVEIGAFESLSLRTWRTRKCFARKPCLVAYRIQKGYRISLFGLVAPAVRRTFETACASLNCPVVRKSGLSPWVPTMSLTEVASVGELQEVQRRTGFERVCWLKDLSEIAIPVGSVHGTSGAGPLNWDLHRTWDFGRRSFLRLKRDPDNQSVALLWYRRSDRGDYFSISQSGAPVSWGWSKTWALLRAYELANVMPFERVGRRSLVTAAAHIHLPLPLARAVAIAGPFLPGPSATDSNGVSYFYSFASQRLRRMAILALWTNLPNLRRERRRLPFDLELLWRASTSNRRERLPMPVLLRDRLASDPLLRRFAGLPSIPISVLPILLSLTNRNLELEGMSKP